VVQRVRLELVISLIGLLISGFAAFFAYNQTELLRYEHLTPYRANLFNERVASFRLILRAHSEALDLTPASYAQYLDTQKADYPKRAFEYLSGYQTLLNTEKALWPRATEAAFGEVSHKLYGILHDTELLGCDRSKLKDCIDNIKSMLDDLEILQGNLERELREVLRADQLDAEGAS